MALLNTASTRPSLIVMILSYLAQRRGKKDNESRLVDALAPPGLSREGEHQSDIRDSLRAAIDLRLVLKDGEDLELAEMVIEPVRKGKKAVVGLLRTAVLDPDSNAGEWGSQAGARDLTNALAWYLTFPAESSPIQMEGAERSAMDLQSADFGPRQRDGGGWPIGNDNRWQAFRYWACSLGFAWVSPKGHILPDPTPAIRAALPALIGKTSELGAGEFIDKLAGVIPVLDYGRYREFVAANWKREEPEQRRLTAPLSEALERLREDGRLVFDDRADAARVVRADGTTFSHIRVGVKR